MTGMRHWRKAARGAFWAALAAGALAFWAPAAIAQAPFGTRVVINGQAADLALDESRGVLYVANFAGRKIDVVGLGSARVERSINLDLNQPSSVALSPDSRYLLVAHYGNAAPPATSTNGLTLIDLARDTRRTFTLSAAPFGVAFGANGKALVSTANSFQIFDPATGTSSILSSVANLAPTTLPVTVPNFPPTITRASLTASANGLVIAGLTDTFTFVYDVTTNGLDVTNYVSTPLQAPRAVSLSRDGSLLIGGWFIENLRNGRTYQFPAAGGDLERGSHIIDSLRNRIYAQIREEGEPVLGGANDRVLQVMDADNLAVLERLRLPENLSGKSVISSDFNRVYSLSESGVVFLPMGDLTRARRIEPGDKLISVRSNFCERRLLTRTLAIRDASGAGSRFSITSSSGGVTVSPSSGVTPATVTITVNPNVFAAAKGTTLVDLRITSPDAVNLLDPVVVAVNTREPDQKGTTIDVGGDLVAIAPDSQRNRFYVLRQDTAEVLVYDANNLRQLARLKTGTTPTSLSLTFDRARLLIGHENSQFIEVYNLDTLEQDAPILSPFGHYPRQIAASASGTLVGNRVAGPIHQVDIIDFTTRRAVPLSSLGPWQNSINEDTALIASGNGSSILLVQPNGVLYHWKDGEFVAARQFEGLTFSGAVAASNFDRFAVGNQIFNGSLTPELTLDPGAGTSSGFVFLGEEAVRTTAANANSPGVIERVNSVSGDVIRPTRMVEAPTLTANPSVFTKTLAVLPNLIVSLSTSGFTALPINYDEGFAPPQITRVVNAADFSAPVAPGGLITIFGTRLSLQTLASNTLPLPTVLADSCLQVNGLPVPFLYVSDTQINAQLPFQAVGNTTLVLRTPGGVSDSFRLVVSPGAPSVFRSATDGTRTDLPTVFRADNGEAVTGSNPVRANGRLVIYLTGLGATSPEVPAGSAAPSDPLARVVVVPRVTIGGQDATVEFAGLSPGAVGVYQINVLVPGNVPTGMSVPLTISQGTVETTVQVRVVR